MYQCKERFVRGQIFSAISMGVKVGEEVPRRFQSAALAEGIALGRAPNKAIVVIDGLLLTFRLLSSAAAAEQQQSQEQQTQQTEADA